MLGISQQSKMGEYLSTFLMLLKWCSFICKTSVIDGRQTDEDSDGSIVCTFFENMKGWLLVYEGGPYS
jgi:hypothetical protein